MITAIIHGNILGTPEKLLTKYDKIYARAKLRVVSDGIGDFVNVVCFEEALCSVLLALTDGDSVALSGTLKVKAYVDKTCTPRASIDMVVRAIMTPYQVIDKLDAIATMEQGYFHDDGKID